MTYSYDQFIAVRRAWEEVVPVLERDFPGECDFFVLPGEEQGRIFLIRDESGTRRITEREAIDSGDPFTALYEALRPVSAVERVWGRGVGR